MKLISLVLRSGLIAAAAVFLALGGCQTAPRGSGPFAEGEAAQAEIALAKSQGQQILQEITAYTEATFQVGDGITIQIWLKDKVSQLAGYPLALTIPESGELFLPHLGLMKIAGKQVGKFQSELQKMMDEILKHVTVIVSRKGERTFGGPEGKGVVVELRKSFVVMGHINRPGLYALEPGLRVRDAIAIAGGVEHYGHPNIYLVRGSHAKPEVKRINLKAIYYGSDLSANVLLQPTDAIYVAPKALYRTADFISLLLSPLSSALAPLSFYTIVGAAQ